MTQDRVPYCHTGAHPSLPVGLEHRPLNDLIGVKVDREKFAGGGPKPGYAVEASALRYPIAQGKLSLGKGIAWFALWYLVALLGAWWLNPFLVAVVLHEAASAQAVPFVYFQF